MPPFSQSSPLSTVFSPNHHKPNNHSSTNIVTIDVGGQIFQTTKQTLTLAGSNTLFSNLFNSYDQNNQIPFVDRDPDLFSILLSVLRTGNLPSKAKLFDIQDIIFEAKYYGIDHLLVQCQSNPSQFEAFNLEKSKILNLGGRDPISVIDTSQNGSVLVSHGSKITSFDWALQRKSTVLTRFAAIDSLLSLSSNVVAAGATDFSGLQIIDLDKGLLMQSLNWENLTKSSSTVQAIGKSPEFLFTSFESGRRNSNSIMVYDVNDGFRTVSEIARNEIFGADLDSCIPAMKLKWVPSVNLLMAAASHSGPSGVSGNIKFWDVRSGEIAWEIKEKSDCFSDVTVSNTLSAVFKIGINSGEASYIDFRRIDSNNSWNYFGGTKKPMNGKKEGLGCKIESHGNQVFCGKEGELEVCSEVLMVENGKDERVFRKNLLGRTKDVGGNRVTNLGFSGSKMFVTRRDQQCVEVWESSRRGF
ncbi:putative transcription factor WD40-like family [Helianthus annuus]|uniref:Chromatin remodeling & transcription regulator BTB-POZ family n=1 Tax=Helianthus annuus TaxID=4232 RepID=A0A9K3HAP9_HELAN|nr:BTB/POZ domain-containing protein At5g41330-like [Helianthus annuus]KAF5772436.1 putative chromatin remodeling & transcription regulator BTB-POZ family [Helianthus annuus]KAJ0476056.1 putative transcription factor WD40-like family [Helianthus annuus]KAJ0496861.1 putative transcription factor WD40-like family [Helianthus annuus]KAJ0662892.1 putative transcription factor WD40-like family [Helianthus annuus]KAJ0848267.1 putative transcription factor WD40-like family [Helianthus annuus]